MLGSLKSQFIQAWDSCAHQSNSKLGWNQTCSVAMKSYLSGSPVCMCWQKDSVHRNPCSVILFPRLSLQWDKEQTVHNLLYT